MKTKAFILTALTTVALVSCAKQEVTPECAWLGDVYHETHDEMQQDGIDFVDVAFLSGMLDSSDLEGCDSSDWIQANEVREAAKEFEQREPN